MNEKQKQVRDTAGRILNQAHKINHKYHILTWMLSILISVMVWLYVTNVENPDRTMVYKDVPVQLLYAQDIRSQYGLVCTNETDPTVNVTLSGAINRLQEVNEEDIVVRVDLSQIKEEGTYSLPYDISPPVEVAVSSSAPATLSLRFEKVVTMDVPVVHRNVGSLRSNLLMDALEYPETVSVIGLPSELEAVQSACFDFPLNDISDSFTTDVSLYLVDRSGDAVECEYLTLKQSTISVDCSILKTAQIPLKVSLQPGKGAKAEDAEVDIQPSAVRVIGTVSDVDRLTTLNVGTISLASGQDSITRKFQITLPEGITLYQDVSAATVNVTFPELEVRDIEVSSFKTGTLPEGYAAVINTTSVKIKVRGTKEDLDALSMGSIMLTADMRDVQAEEGVYVVPAFVTVSKEFATKVGVFGDYTLSVTLKRS